MSTADGSVASPSYGDAGGTLAAPPTFLAEPLCFASCLRMVSLRPVQACFAILHTVGGVIDHPPPPHSSSNLMLGDGGTLGALDVQSGGNVLGEQQNSDSRVDASDVDTDISSRLNMYKGAPFREI